MGTKWGLSYVSYVIHTIHWILSPLPFFISLFQLRLVLFFVYFFLLFSLFLALPFQDCKGPITITKRRLSKWQPMFTDVNNRGKHFKPSDSSLFRCVTGSGTCKAHFDQCSAMLGTVNSGFYGPFSA